MISNNVERERLYQELAAIADRADAKRQANENTVEWRQKILNDDRKRLEYMKTLSEGQADALWEMRNERYRG